MNRGEREPRCYNHAQKDLFIDVSLQSAVFTEANVKVSGRLVC